MTYYSRLGFQLFALDKVVTFLPKFRQANDGRPLGFKPRNSKTRGRIRPGPRRIGRPARPKHIPRQNEAPFPPGQTERLGFPPRSGDRHLSKSSVPRASPRGQGLFRRMPSAPARCSSWEAFPKPELNSPFRAWLEKTHPLPKARRESSEARARRFERFLRARGGVRPSIGTPPGSSRAPGLPKSSRRGRSRRPERDAADWPVPSPAAQSRRARAP